MERHKVDLLRQTQDTPAHPRKPVVFFGRVGLFGAIFAATAIAALTFRVGGGGGNGQFPSFSILSTISHLVGTSENQLRGEEGDRVNILLMGIGGDGHEGPQLTDTLMLASYKPSTKQVALVSVPRDLAVPIPGHGVRKINSANALGEAQEKGTGPALTKETVKNVFGQEMNYYLRIDFDGFAEIIDQVGGVDIYVDRAFSDSAYPILGKEETDCGSTETVDATTGERTRHPVYDCRFETLSFKEGWAHMTGSTALKYVRSRHGTAGEASDFARSRRQQKVILALKDRLFSASTLLNPAKVNQLRDILQKNISTDLETWEILKLASALKDFNQTALLTRVLDDAPDSPVFATSLNGAYVLLPKNDDWQPVRALVGTIFAEAPSPAVSHPQAPVAEEKAKPQFAKVEIQNGTTITGLAFRFSQLLSAKGYEVPKIGNAAQRGYDHTVLYDLTDGREPEKLKALREYLKADVTLSSGGWLVSGDVVPKELTLSPEDYAAKPTEPGVDFLVILGQNSADLVKK